MDSFSEALDKTILPIRFIPIGSATLFFLHQENEKLYCKVYIIYILFMSKEKIIYLKLYQYHVNGRYNTFAHKPTYRPIGLTSFLFLSIL